MVPLKEAAAMRKSAEPLVKRIAIEGQGHNIFAGLFRSQELGNFARIRALAGVCPDSRGLDTAPGQWFAAPFFFASNQKAGLRDAIQPITMSSCVV